MKRAVATTLLSLLFAAVAVEVGSRWVFPRLHSTEANLAVVESARAILDRSLPLDPSDTQLKETVINHGGSVGMLRRYSSRLSAEEIARRFSGLSSDSTHSEQDGGSAGKGGLAIHCVGYLRISLDHLSDANGYEVFAGKDESEFRPRGCGQLPTTLLARGASTTFTEVTIHLSSGALIDFGVEESRELPKLAMAESGYLFVQTTRFEERLDPRDLLGLRKVFVFVPGRHVAAARSKAGPISGPDGLRVFEYSSSVLFPDEYCFQNLPVGYATIRTGQSGQVVGEGTFRSAARDWRTPARCGSSSYSGSFVLDAPQ